MISRTNQGSPASDPQPRRARAMAAVWLATMLAVAVTGSLMVACQKRDDPSMSGEPGTKTATPKVTGKVVTLSFVYGSEKKAWLVDAITRFNQSPMARTDGFTIQVEGKAMGSGVAVAEIVEQTSQPHIWSPASDVYRVRLNREWAKRQGAVGGTKELANDAKPLVLSPVVIAMWKPMAQALGWPQTPIGWSDVLALSTDAKGWASKNHPEWGLFKFGHTHPEYSNSGLLAVLAEAYAATGATTGLTTDKLDDPALHKYLEEIESSVVHYGKSTGFFATKMLERGPSYLSAAVVYENLIIDSYKQPEHQDREFDLVAIYPKEGTFWIDNPLVILDAPWVTDEHKKAGRIFRDFLLAKDMQTLAMSEYGFRPSDPSIAMTRPITAEFGVDAKQPQTLLDVPEPEVVEHALATWKQTKKTVELMFVFDRSGSMKGQPLREAKAGAQDFLSMLDNRDRVAVVMFNHQVPPTLPEPMAMGTDRATLTSQVENTFADGGTALHDAIYAAHVALRAKADKNPKQMFALVVLSDGRDEHSQMSYDELLQAIAPSAELGVTVRLFTIGYGSGADKTALENIANAGGGAFFSSDAKSIRQVYRDLAAFF